MTTTRAATEQDASAIAHVHVESWRTTYAGVVPATFLASLSEAERTPRWRELLAGDMHAYVAEVEHEVVGFIAGGRIREPIEAYDAELFAVYLLQRAQRQGLGTALLKELASALRDKGFESMAVWVLAGNASARFYEKAGARLLSSKDIEIGGATLPVLAFGWPSLAALAAQ